ncbi:TadE/TadG family type IV pilus assembly protein [Variovorax sp. H27-G14]|uniref:TadE/TadG family type IV pilus assembly protein n=1 Tax=Variovorax sp. H27-G14 TaxID=3111914 RepID=UPI0038FC60E5
MKNIPTVNPRPTAQRGVAAVELALVMTTVLLLLYGVVSFGAVLYAQQVVSRAAEDGARAISGVNDPTQATNIALIKSVVYASMATSLIAPANAGNTTAQRQVWLKSNPKVIVNVGASGLVTVSYPYGDNPIVALPDAWVPQNIFGSAKFSL